MLKDRWTLKISTGFYYLTMYNNVNFGFENLSGLQLYPTLGYLLSPKDSLTLYGKFSPVSDGFSLFNLSSREIAAGLSWTRRVGESHSLITSFDFSWLHLSFQSLIPIQVDEMTYNLSFGFGW